MTSSRSRTRAWGRILAAAGLLAARPALADRVSADLALTPSATTNVMTTTLTATLLGQTRQDTEASAISGNVLADLGIAFDPLTAAPAGINTIAFTGGRVAVSDTTFNLSWGFVGSLTIKGIGIQGTVSTPTPPGLVNDGALGAADHRLLLDQGVLTVTGTSLIGAMIPPDLSQVNLADSPMGGSGDGTGSVTISAPSLGKGTASYWIELRLPVNYDELVADDDNGTMRATGSGMIEARGQVVRLIPAWEALGGGSWQSANNWQGGSVPDVPGATARFIEGQASATITLDGDRTVGALVFDNSTAFIIAPGIGGALRLNNQGTGAAVVVASGSHRLDAPLRADDSTIINIAAGSGLQLTAGLSVADGLAIRKTNPGALSVEGGITLGAGSSLDVRDGMVHVDQLTGGTLSIGGSGVVMIEPQSGDGPSSVRAIEFDGLPDAWQGRLGLSGRLVVQADAASAAEAFARIVNQVKAARNAPEPWMGQGIGSSAAAANPLMAVAAVLNGDNITLQPAWAGDADLNGVIDGNDYFLLDQGFLAAASGWAAGDFDYSGVIDAQDYHLIDRSLLVGVGGVSALATVPVPEPSIPLAAGLLLAIAAGRRRCRGTAGSHSQWPMEAGRRNQRS